MCNIVAKSLIQTFAHQDNVNNLLQMVINMVSLSIQNTDYYDSIPVAFMLMISGKIICYFTDL